MTEADLKKAKSELRQKPYMTQYGMWKIRKGKERVFAENIETHKFTPSFLYKELDKLLTFIDNIHNKIIPNEQSPEWQSGFIAGMRNIKNELKRKMGEEKYNEFFNEWFTWD